MIVKTELHCMRDMAKPGKVITALLLLLALCSLHAAAQNLLTIDEALRIGLGKNYLVLIDSNVMRATGIRNSPGAAGFLPRLDLEAGATYSGQNINQEFSSGTEIDKKNVSNQSQTAGAYLTWTLFDGMNRFATAKFLKLQEEQAGTVSKDRVQQLMASIINAYYAVVQRKQWIRLLDSSIVFYDVALNTARNLQLNGKGTRQQVLQAQIDRNAAQAEYILQKNNLMVDKTNLNQLLQRNPETDFDVQDTIPLLEAVAVDTSEIYLRSSNPSLIAANREVDIQTTMLQQSRSLYFPRLDLDAGYAFNNSSSSGSFFLKNQNVGWNAGLTLSWNLFNGNQSREQVQIARIGLDNARLSYRQLLSETQTAISTANRNYLTAKEEMRLLRENLLLAYENLQLATEQYKLFAITQIDLQRAHKSFDDAGLAYLLATYRVKQFETNLLSLTGRLVQ
jgi:outer membrane protein TolC